MPLYAIEVKKRLKPIKEQGARRELEIHTLIESNLEGLFGLKLVAHEFTVQNVTLDTLAFSEETQAFLIIEYKRDEGKSVVDQGYAYLATMLNNKAEFVLKYNETFGQQRTKAQFDWSQSRVMFITQRFTPHQILAINFKDLPIELWRFNWFENETLFLEQVKPNASAASIGPLMRGRQASTVQREVAVRTPDDVLGEIPKRLRSLFEEFDAAVRAALPEIELGGRKWGLTFKRRWAGVSYVKFQKDEIRLDLRLPRVPAGNGIAEARAVKESDPYKVAARIKKPEDIRVAVELMRTAYREAGRALGETE